MLTGSCHCGAIQFCVTRKPRQLTHCNCSICRRYGAIWLYGTHRTIKLSAPADTAIPYLWNGRNLAFYHCRHCGCLTHYQSTARADRRRIAVNARMLEPGEIARVRVRTFDGAATWRYLD